MILNKYEGSNYFKLPSTSNLKEELNKIKKKI